jgi:hypothetical protein
VSLSAGDRPGGIYTVEGSTDWSLSGEWEQDNGLELSRSPVVAAESRAILDLNHDFMLEQMVGTHLDVAKYLVSNHAPSTPPLPPAPLMATEV